MSVVKSKEVCWASTSAAFGPARAKDRTIQLLAARAEAGAILEYAELTLQSDQSPPVEHLKLYFLSLALVLIPLVQARADPLEIFGPTAGVGDDVEAIICVLCDDRVVEDAALVVEQDRECTTEWLEGAQGSRCQALEERLRARTRDAGDESARCQRRKVNAAQRLRETKNGASWALTRTGPYALHRTGLPARAHACDWRLWVTDGGEKFV